MGRVLPVLPCFLVMLCCGCRATPSGEYARCELRWQRVCEQMRSSHTSRATPREVVRPLKHNETSTLHAVAAEAAASVVHIQTLVRRPVTDGERTRRAHPACHRSGGTGIIIDRRGLILTSEHVVRDATGITVVLANGSTWPVKRLVVDDRLDLAILQIDVADSRPLLLTSSPVDRGTPVVAVGWCDPETDALGRPGIVTDMYASLQHEIDPTRRRCYTQLIESTAQLAPGFSGGPLLDMRGRMIGLNVAIAGSGKSCRAYAVPLFPAVQDHLARLIAGLTGSAKPTRDGPHVPTARTERDVVNAGD